jgi:hypothetical protein
MSHRDDPDHLDYAAQHGYVLLTYNMRDFKNLHRQWHAQGRTHAGIFFVRFDNILGKDMGYHDIVRAIANLLVSGVPIANEMHVLNHWQ